MTVLGPASKLQVRDDCEVSESRTRQLSLSGPHYRPAPLPGIPGAGLLPAFPRAGLGGAAAGGLGGSACGLAAFHSWDGELIGSGRNI
jgi:hypothetical protein